MHPETQFYSKTNKVYGVVIDSETTNGPFGKTYENLISYYFVTSKNDTIFNRKQNRNLGFQFATGCRIGVEYQINKPEKNYPYFLKEPEYLKVNVVENANYKLSYTKETFVFARKGGPYLLKDKVFGVVLSSQGTTITLKDLRTKRVEKLNLNRKEELNLLFCD